MKAPCESAGKFYIKELRGAVARLLREKHALTQKRIAELMGLTQAAISGYLNAQCEATGDLRTCIEGVADRIVNKLMSGAPVTEILREICSNCLQLRMRGPLCAFHRLEMPSLQGVDCQACIPSAADHEAVGQRATVLKELEVAASLLEESPDFVYLLPEVMTNLVGCTQDAGLMTDVAAFPGRIVKLKGKAVALNPPEFGASTHTAGILLQARRSCSKLRACLAIRLSDKLLEFCKRQGFEEISLQNTRQLLSNDLEFAFSVVEPAVGVEGVIYVFATDSIQLARQFVSHKFW